MKVGTIKVKQKIGRRFKTKEEEVLLVYPGSIQKTSKPEGMKVKQKGGEVKEVTNLCKAELRAEPSG